jgi:hypothetical protein
MSFHSDDEDGLSAASEYDNDELEDTSGDVSSQKAPAKGTEQPVLAQKETRLVNRAKILVYTVLFVVAGAAAFGTYWFVDQDEQTDFEQQVSLSVTPSPRKILLSLYHCMTFTSL